MSKLTIPEVFRKGVLRLATLDPDLSETIALALSRDLTSPPGNKSASVLKKMVTKGISKSEFEDMLKALKALYTVRGNADVPAKQFIEDVLAAIQEHQKRVWNTAELKIARNNLGRLLGIESIQLSSAVKSVGTDDERSFCKAKILTELRPVFVAEKPDDEPRGMVVVHRLKLGYHQNKGKHQDFFVTLDAEDLESLKEVINRAEMRSASLQKHLDKIQIIGA